jgi:hypothetical protein
MTWEDGYQHVMGKSQGYYPADYPPTTKNYLVQNVMELRMRSTSK